MVIISSGRIPLENCKQDAFYCQWDNCKTFNNTISMKFLSYRIREYFIHAGAGVHIIRLEVSNCDRSRIGDLASGFFSTSRFLVEELPMTGAEPSDSNNFIPIWHHCTVPNLNDPYDNGTINGTRCSFTKKGNDTDIMVSWDGSVRVLNCM